MEHCVLTQPRWHLILTICFPTIAEKLVSKLPTPSKQFDTDSTVFKEYYSEIAPPKFKLETVSEDFVLKELKKS